MGIPNELCNDSYESQYHTRTDYIREIYRTDHMFGLF